MNKNEKWYCPATKKEISEGLCWEYYFADRGGPIDAAHELRQWIKTSKAYKSIYDFHKVCDKSCPHKI